MYAQIEKTKENKSRAVANSVAQKKINGRQGFGFVDNRSEAIQMLKLQEMANIRQLTNLSGQLNTIDPYINPELSPPLTSNSNSSSSHVFQRQITIGGEPMSDSQKKEVLRRINILNALKTVQGNGMLLDVSMEHGEEFFNLIIDDQGDYDFSDIGSLINFLKDLPDLIYEYSVKNRTKDNINELANEVMNMFKRSYTGYEVAESAEKKELGPVINYKFKKAVKEFEEKKNRKITKEEEANILREFQYQSTDMTRERGEGYLKHGRIDFNTDDEDQVLDHPIRMLSGYQAYASTNNPDISIPTQQAMKENSELWKILMNNAVPLEKMKESQINEYFDRAVSKDFGNCDVQAGITAMKMYYKLGLTDVVVISNKKISHNYAVLPPSSMFLQGAVIDPWRGHGLREWDMNLKKKYKHEPENIQVQEGLTQWIKGDKGRVFYTRIIKPNE